MRFLRYIGIHYSGAEVPLSSLTGLRVYMADRTAQPFEVEPPVTPRKYWTRAAIAAWLSERLLQEDTPTLVGIDHGFSFPLAYFREHRLPLDWTAFLMDFQRHWPTDDDHMYVDFVRDGIHGDAFGRFGSPRWRRLTEIRAGRSKSVFHFAAPRSVAKATHAGLPWLLRIRRQAGDRVHFWPFDGWDVPSGRSVIAEVYPAWRSKLFLPQSLNTHQGYARSIVAWLRESDLNGSLIQSMSPALSLEERKIAEIEGWILGTP
jgi:hypothetical protein